MTATFTLILILISASGIDCLSRRARATQDLTAYQTTISNAAVAVSKIKPMEQSTRASDSDFTAKDSFDLHPDVYPSSAEIKKAKEAKANNQRKSFRDGSNIPASGQNRNLNQNKMKGGESVSNVFHQRMKTSGDEEEDGGVFEPSTDTPETFSLRISAESFEIDASINKENKSEDLKKESEHWSNLPKVENENVYSNPEESHDVSKTQNVNEDAEEGNLYGDRATTMDPVDEEIKHVLDALPKLPELAFPENGTEFVYHKDPEEAALDDRITQVARQLAETSLKREYEEQKLGHYIPIRLRHFDDEYTSNSFTPSRKSSNDKTYGNALDVLRQIQQPQIRFRALSIPQHIYNGPMYRSKDEQSKYESPGPVYLTKPDGDSRVAVASLFNPNTFGAVVELSPRYVLPVPKIPLDQNRMPLLFSLSQPRASQAFHNHNDLNMYSYREIA